MSNRILDYPEATEITSDDYILLDNEGTGAKCIKASALNINMDNYTIKEASGAIASFDDGEDLPLAFMGAYITAIQDLHGYDYPWVGGAGKNKFDESNFNDDTSWQYYTLTLNPNTTYTASSNNGNYYKDNTFPQLYVYETGSGAGSNNAVYTGHSVNITTGSDGVLKVQWKTNNNSKKMTSYHLQVEQGNQASSFAPYSNICPISGWDEVNVTRCGKNLWTGTHGVITSCIIPKNTQFCVSTDKGSGTSQFHVYDENKNRIDYWNIDLIDGDRYYKTFTLNKDVYYVMFGSTVNTNYQINLGTDKEYTEKGLVYDITFQDGSTPLTVYGGTLDVVSGVLTVDRGYVDLGTLDWQYSSIDEKFYARATPLGVKATDVSTPFNAISSALIAKSYNEIDAKTVDNAIGINPNATQFFARCSSITSASEFITAMNGVQLVYELATPLTIQLSPTIIYSLIGENNIFANTGDSIVDYRKLWVKPEM